MSQYAAKFVQSPAEVKRYVMDFTLDLAAGENVETITTAIQQNSGVASPALVVNSIALLPANSAGQVYGFAFFVSAGVNAGIYEVQFLVTTSLGQTFEEIVLFTLVEKL